MVNQWQKKRVKKAELKKAEGRGMKRWRSISTVTKHVKVCVTAAFFPVTGSIQKIGSLAVRMGIGSSLGLVHALR